jgi:putative ABC transport system permease protein
MSWRSDLRHVAELFAESWRTVWAQRAGTLTTAVIVAAVTGTILATTGQTDAAERDVLARLDEAGSRILVVTDASGAGVIPAEIVPVIERLSSTEWVVGLGMPEDGRNAAVGAGGEPVPFRDLHGRLPDDVAVPARHPAPGEALVGAAAATALGIPSGHGAVTLTGGGDVPIVGAFDAPEALPLLEETGVIVTDPSAGGAVQRLYVLARSAPEATALTRAVVALIDPPQEGDLRVESPQVLADLRMVIAGDLGRFGRELLLAVLAAGMVLVAGSVFGQTLLRRRELGRRRALGATRGTLVGLLLAQTALTAAMGAALGLVVGTAVVVRTTGVAPSGGFVAGAALLAVLCATLSAVGPAVAAAYRDPLHVLRTP